MPPLKNTPLLHRKTKRRNLPLFMSFDDQSRPIPYDEGACKPVIQSRFKRPDMRWKPVDFLNVLALRLDSMEIPRPFGPAVDSRARLRDDLENEDTPNTFIR